MKAIFEHVNNQSTDSSFYSYRLKQSHFPFIWHYHPELELTYICQGTGTRLVGDHIASFQEGDLVFLGANLPHTWASEEEKSKDWTTAEIIGIQFRADLLTGHLLDMPEFKSIQQLVKKSKRGLHFGKATAIKVEGCLKELLELEGLEKLLHLWRILDCLAKAQDVQYLASEIYAPVLGKENEQRIDAALFYIHEHFLDTITLAQMSKVTNMTATSFCRFFKKMTNKSLSEYVNNLRIGRACHLLTETDYSISEAAFKSGFNSTTHFNRMFLKKKGHSPRVYRTAHRERKILTEVRSQTEK